MSLETTSNTPLNTTITERRKHVRHDIRLFAKIKFETYGTFFCEIKDFCTGGLALDLSEAESKLAELNVLLYKSAVVGFFSPHQQQSYHSQVRVVRSTGSNIGVSFEETPALVLEALHQHLSQSQAEEGKLMATVSHSPTSHAEKHRKKKSLSNTVNQFSDSLLKRFFDHIQTALFDTAESADNNADRMACYEANTDLQIQKRSIEVEFCKLLLSRVERAFAATDDIEQKATATNSLTLVSKNEFEDWLNVSEIILQIEACFEHELHELIPRLTSLLGFTVDNKNNPVGPSVLCQSFQAAIDELAPNVEIRNTVFRTFGDALKDQLDDLYQSLNTLLFDVPIPTAIEQTTTPVSEVTCSENSIDSNIADTTDDDNSRVVNATDEETAEAIQPRPHTRTADKQNIYQAASHLLNLCQQSHGNEYRTTAPQNNETAYNAEQVLDLLNSIDLPATNMDEPIDHTASDFWHTLSEQGINSNLIRQEDRDALNISNQIYSNIQRKTHALESSLNSFQKLRMPLLKTALQDPTFLNTEEEHPVRKVFNQVDRLSSSLEEQEDEIKASLVEKLSDILQRIEDSAGENNPTAFAEITEELEQVIKPLDRRRVRNIKSVIEKAEGQERIKKAKRNVHQALKSRISDKLIPSALLQLLDAGWKQLLFRADLRDGQGGMTEQVYLDTLDQLLALFNDQGQIKPTGAVEKSHSTTIPALLDYIYDELSTVCAETSRLDTVMKDLTELLNNPDASATKSDIVKVSAKHFDSTDEAETTLPASWQQWNLMIEKIKIGQWFKFIDTDPEQILNLAWVNESKTHFIFISREGIKKKELNRRKLAMAFRQGKVCRHENLDTPLMTRATDNMMQDMLDEAIQEATHDSKTRLINRKEFIKHLKQELTDVKHGELTHILSCLEIDQVRIIANGCGHDAVDRLLATVVKLLRKQFKQDAIIARLGDARFGILNINSTVEQTREKLNLLLDAVKDFQFTWEDKSYTPGFNIGVIEMSRYTDNVENLLKQGDLACLEAKKAGPNGMYIFNQDDKQSTSQQEILEWTGHFDKVLRENQLFLRGQQIKPVSEASGAGHYEILLGVKDKAGKVISPENFILAAELCKRMPEVDRWVIGSAFSWISQHPQAFNAMDGFSINLSGQSVTSQEILDYIQSQFATTGISPKQITFEITETAAIHDVDVAVGFIQKLKRLGCTFSLDDFGSGFSSYAYLKQMDVDYLKIDGMFVKDLDHSLSDYAMVKSMNEIGHSLGLKTIAEYVENGMILKKLMEIGVDFVQGYGIRKPTHLDELIKEGV